MATSVKRGWGANLRGERHRRTWLLGLTLMVFLLPVFWSFLASMNVVPDDTSSPPHWSWPPTLQNYIDIGVTEPDFLSEMAWSTLIAITATTLTVFISFLAAYGLARSQARKVQIGVQGFLVLASLPVMAYILPLRDVIYHLGLYDTFVGVSLANTAVFSPRAVYVLYG